MPYIDDNLHVNSWILSHGGVAEWLKAHDSKSCRPARVSWVQIPPPPLLIRTRFRRDLKAGAKLPSRKATGNERGGVKVQKDKTTYFIWEQID